MRTPRYYSRGLVPVWGLLLLWASPLYAQQRPAPPAPPNVQITGVTLHAERQMRIAYLDAEGKAQTLDLPTVPLESLVAQMAALPAPPGASLQPATPPAPPQPGTGDEDKEDGSAPRSFRTEHRSVNGRIYDIAIYRDSLVRISYHDKPQEGAITMPPFTLQNIQKMNEIVHPRMSRADENVFEGMIDFGQNSLLLRVIYETNVWVVLGLLTLTPLFLGSLILWRRLRRVLRERDELAASRRRIVDAREAERRFLSSELHDGPVQGLQNLLRSTLKPMARTAPDEAQQSTLETACAQMQDVVDELRSICKRLIPPVLVHLGFDRAIKSHVEDFQQQHGLTVQLDLDAEETTLPLPMRLALFRMCQEALNNVVKHAQAQRVAITFRMDEEQVSLRILDDGRGFDPPERMIELETKGHLGLSGIAERAQAIGGVLRVDSSPGRGTLVSITAPRPASS